MSNVESSLMGLFPVPRTRWERVLHVVKQLPLYMIGLMLCSHRIGIIPEKVQTPLFVISCIGFCITLYYDARRWRARTRWMQAGLTCFSLSIVWLVVMPMFLSIVDDTEMLREMLIAGGGMAVACAVCYLFWRRSVARAQWRLQMLLRERRQQQRRALYGPKS